MERERLTIEIEINPDLPLGQNNRWTYQVGDHAEQTADILVTSDRLREMDNDPLQVLLDKVVENIEANRAHGPHPRSMACNVCGTAGETPHGKILPKDQRERLMTELQSAADPNSL